MSQINSRIQQLPSNVINQIAAGEVIERPASVVKELVENSIDAKASQIFVNVEDYGRELIEIRDDGYGMSETDIEQCIKRHATSKIQDYKDIYAITSLGFRGEALPSIASISKFEIVSRTKNQIEGVRVQIQDELIVESTPAGHPVGTTMSVREIFYNTPVRKKFLKADRTELSAISDTLNKIALIYPHIEFTFNHNGKKVFSYKKNQCLKERIYEVLGKNFSDSSSEIIFEDEELFIRGFIGAPTVSKVNMTGIYVFLNGRFIKDKTINHAINQAYKTLLMGGKYPLALLSIEMKPEFVDVNIHPTKSEVKFEDPNKIHNLVKMLIQKKLSSHFWIDTTVPAEPTEPTEAESKIVEQKLKAVHDEIKSEKFARRQTEIAQAAIQSPYIKCEEPVVADSSTIEDMTQDIAQPKQAIKTKTTPVQMEVEDLDEKPKFYSSLQLIGQFNKQFIILEKDSSLYMIDHHAAHERVNFERIKADFASQKIASQELLIPLVLDLDKTKTALLQKLSAPFLNIGIEFEHFGDNTFVVKRVPAIIPEEKVSEVVTDIIDRVMEEDDLLNSEEIVWEAISPELERIFALLACHSSIRGKESLTPQEITALMNQLDELNIKSNCPHGRPIIVEHTMGEIEKRFSRIV